MGSSTDNELNNVLFCMEADKLCTRGGRQGEMFGAVANAFEGRHHTTHRHGLPAEYNMLPWAELDGQGWHSRRVDRVRGVLIGVCGKTGRARATSAVPCFAQTRNSLVAANMLFFVVTGVAQGCKVERTQGVEETQEQAAVNIDYATGRA